MLRKRRTPRGERRGTEGLSRHVAVSRAPASCHRRVPAPGFRAGDPPPSSSRSRPRNSFRRRGGRRRRRSIFGRGGCHPRSHDRRYKQISVAVPRRFSRSNSSFATTDDLADASFKCSDLTRPKRTMPGAFAPSGSHRKLTACGVRRGVTESLTLTSKLDPRLTLPATATDKNYRLSPPRSKTPAGRSQRHPACRGRIVNYRNVQL